MYQRSTGTLVYSSAGHPPSILLRGPAGERCRGVPAGDRRRGARHFSGRELPFGSFKVEPGDRLLLLSDGTFEVEKADGEMLAFSEFVDFLAAPGGDEPNAVLAWIKSLNGAGPLPDDFSLLRVVF